MTSHRASPPPPVAPAALLRERVARGVIAQLQSQSLPAAAEERLRAAREQALLRARERRARAVGGMVAPASLPAGRVAGAGGGAPVVEGPGWWERPVWRWLGAAVPLLALVAGLVAIQASTERARIRAAAAVDAALLADELPPGAYSDPAFVEFLNAGRRP